MKNEKRNGLLKNIRKYIAPYMLSVAMLFGAGNAVVAAQEVRIEQSVNDTTKLENKIMNTLCEEFALVKFYKPDYLWRA